MRAKRLMNPKTEGKWLILIALAAFLIFANSLNGELVYDDKRQILMNALIQEPTLYGRALTLDVWAFKGDGQTITSNYWRPTFTAWCILNFWLFGTNPFGWHLLNILLHVGVCLLAYILLRRWNLSEILAFCICLMFAVHSVHTETVAWIAGSPDLLFALFLLASFLFSDIAAKAVGARQVKYVASALVCYLLALGAKEVAFFCFPIFYLIFSGKRARPKSESDPNQQSPLLSFLFAGAVIVFFLIRWIVLGRISMPAENAASTSSIFLSAPEIFAFYLRQIVFPYWLGPNYGLRPVESVEFWSFILPLIISLAAVYCIWVLAKRSFVQTAGAAIFILPLLSVFNVPAFLPEQIVHDRYLYLPLLGFLMMTLPFAHEMLKKYFDRRAESVLLTVTIIVCIPLSVKTFFYNRVWGNELALWRHSVTIDPNSSFNWSALGSELTEQERTADAINAYDKSLAISPRPLAYIGRAQSFIKKENFDAAIRDLKTVIATPPEKIDAYALYQAYEALAIAYQSRGSLNEAEEILRDGRNRLPMYNAALTEKLAIILYNQNKKPDALKELEAAKTNAARELLPASKSVFFRLGLLYAEAGNREAAVQNLNLFLQTTASAKDKETDNQRRDALVALQKLRL